MRDSEEFKKAIKRLEEILREARDISHVDTLKDLQAQKKAISLVQRWVSESFGVELKVSQPPSGIEGIFEYKSDTSASEEA